jgi:hypothetical protein
MCCEGCWGGERCSRNGFRHIFVASPVGMGKGKLVGLVDSWVRDQSIGRVRWWNNRGKLFRRGNVIHLFGQLFEVGVGKRKHDAQIGASEVLPVGDMFLHTPHSLSLSVSFSISRGILL